MPAPRPPGDRLPAGALLSHYRIEALLGAGGMGVVYRATDVRLNRQVALKVVAAGSNDDTSRRRFVQEARAAAAFNHPHVVTIHEVDSEAGVDFIVMELLSGEALDKLIARAPLPIADAIAFGEQVASALESAHALGIVHRDIKPANVMVTDSGHLKLLDFGIAKQLAGAAPASARTATMADATMPGAILGSVAYMSPEQAQGHAVDGRSDVFSLGVLLYELLSAHRPFGGTTAVETVAKILESTPAPVESIRYDVPHSLSAIVAACLEKDRSRRPTAAEVHRAFAALSRPSGGPLRDLANAMRRPAVLVSAAVLLLVAASGTAWWWSSGREQREANRRVPHLLDLAARGDSAFYAEAVPVLKMLPDDRQLKDAVSRMTFVVPQVTSEPPGAEVLAKPYGNGPWVSLGQTPLDSARFPNGTTTRLKLVKDGYATYDGTITLYALSAALQPIASVPEGMVWVPGGAVTVEGSSATVAGFWLDKFEVTNRQFKAFVDAGGYTNPRYWTEPLSDGGQPVTWAQAMTRFRDQTGRPGPSAWVLGSYPEGQEDFPVGGVSWFEAVAYAAYAGKSIPTGFQWRLSGDFLGPSGVYGDVLLFSNFGTTGARRVGESGGVGPYGQYDMAGNVKEWCWNEARGGRLILGGGWNEPKYMYEDRDAQSPMNRASTHGIRLVKNRDGAPQPAASYAAVKAPDRDYLLERPVTDDVFSVFQRLYAYDPRPLNARLERTEETAAWRRDVVTLDAAYGDERILGYVYLPKNATPPFQAIIYFPGGDAPLLRSSRELNLTNVDFIIRSGRALVYPVYKGTYERVAQPSGPNGFRDLTVARVKDFHRVMEYLDTRKDIDTGRRGYFGVSLGAFNGMIINALEPRLAVNVFMGGGLARGRFPSEIDPLNFVTRIHTPTLMVNGASDFQFPLETTQKPAFRLLPLPPDRKRHAFFDGGHMPNQIHDVMREILDWLDRFLGPVTTVSVNGTS